MLVELCFQLHNLTVDSLILSVTHAHEQTNTPHTVLTRVFAKIGGNITKIETQPNVEKERLEKLTAVFSIIFN